MSRVASLFHGLRLAFSPRPDAPAQRPELGEATADQSRRGGNGSLPGIATGMGITGVGTFDLNPPAQTNPLNGTCPTAFSQTQLIGYREPLPGDYATYRLMSSHPTLALAKAVVVGPILASAWSFEADEGVPDERVQFIREQLEPMRPLILNEAMRALETGWRPFEKVYEADGGQLCLRKLKPLLPDLTKVLVDKATGRFAGLVQGSGDKKVELPPEKCFVYTYDGEAGDFYGRSRHENARKVWSQWEQANYTSGKLGNKVSSIVPIVKFPRGSSRTNDQDEIAAQTIDNRRAAQSLIDGLSTAKGVAFETEHVDADDLRANPDLAKLARWAIETVDVGSSAAAMSGLVGEREYFDKLLFRAWLLAERTALEGHHGTLAEAEAHADIGITGSDLLHADFVRCLNWYVVDDLLALNFGEDARGSVWITPAPIVDKRLATIRQIFTAMLGNPGTLEMVLSETDRDAVYDILGVPKGNMIAGGMGEPEGNGKVPPNVADRISQAFEKVNGERDEA